MISVVFWNLAKNPTTLGHIACLARTLNVDVFFLAEAPKNLKPALRELAGLQQGRYDSPSLVRTKIGVLSRLQESDFVHRFTSIGREMVIWTVRAPNLNPQELLIACGHLGSKMGGATQMAQAAVAEQVAAEIAEVEDERSHRNTVFVGDFNMSPFDPGMTLVTGFHGLMTQQLAGLADRRHRSKNYRRFYNPMWGLFGDRTPGPPGTHFWRSSILENHHWTMLDQVLLRSSIASRLQTLNIIDNDGLHSLLGNDGAPDKSFLSDHLPIHFALDI